MSALELAAAIRSRQTSRKEVIESHRRRIEAVNPSINWPAQCCGISVLKPTLGRIPLQALSSRWMRRSASS
jgi:Asp-tRNA(Asn)/Glu-tRNA(Gln) amidotransferase A subunit family amidase